MNTETGSESDNAAARPYSDPVNEILRLLLTRQGLRSADVGRVLGLTQTQASARLNGRIDWRLSELRAVADLLGVRLGDLINTEVLPAVSASA